MNVNFVQAQLVNDLYSASRRYGIKVIQTNLPEYVTDLKSISIPDTVFKKLIHCLYISLTPKQFLEVCMNSISNSVLPQVLIETKQEATLMDALNIHNKQANKVMTSVSMKIEQLYGKYWISQSSYPEKYWNDAVEAYSIIYLIILIEKLTMKKWAPISIGLSGSDSTSIQNRVQREVDNWVVGRQRLYLEIAQETLNLPIISPYKNAKNILSTINIDEDFLSRFKYTIKPYALGGKVPIEFIADLLETNVRTLQRKLKASGTTYRDEMDKVIVEFTKELLSRSDFTITDIATYFQYANTANFTRMFKRNTGMSPTTFMKNLSLNPALKQT